VTLDASDRVKWRSEVCAFAYDAAAAANFDATITFGICRGQRLTVRRANPKTEEIATLCRVVPILIVAAGVQAMAAPGHTMFLITSGNETMAAIGDTTHHHVLLLEKLLMEFAYHTDPNSDKIRITDEGEKL